MHRTRLGLALSIRMDRMPAPMLPVDNPIFPFGRIIVDAVGQRVCAYAIPMMWFLAEGAAGMVAMERLMRYLPNNLPLLLDLRWRDPGSMKRCARAAFEVWGADAVTVAPEFPAEAARAFAAHRGGAVFWWVGEAGDFQQACRHARTARAQGIPAGLAISAFEGISAGDPEDLPWIALDVTHPSRLSPAASWPPPAVVFVGDPILYASPRMDFQEAAREAVEQWLQEVAARFPVE
ncbi:MAG: hypothetical protein RMK32_02205 [Anaerolineae bacterium]|nr:hypothetical protein [Thermoflexus sp.]MDW8064430.1 hypothetical protein [Anaerolineae bacterium]